MEQPRPRVQVRWGVFAIVAAVVVGAVAYGLDRIVLHVGPVVAVAAFAVVAVAGVGLVVERYRNFRFELEDDALYIERGVLTRVETAVPYVRVQHVDTRRDALDRSLGLSSVVVYTAGSRGADVRVPGLRPERARALRERLRELAVEIEPEDAV